MRDINDIDRGYERLQEHALFNLLDRQTDLVHYRNLTQFEQGTTDELRAETNEEIWGHFVGEELYDTRRVVLEAFHLFDWFPLSPGRFHTERARYNRREAEHFIKRSPEGEMYFDPYGKALMIDGGVGNVRLMPRDIDGEPHYFMTASSTGVCHQGFPLLVPRRFYGPIKRDIQANGFTAATVRGEMRFLPENLRTLFDNNREIPLIYLQINEAPRLTPVRDEVTRFGISVAVSFRGELQGEEGIYATFATFDPTTRGDKQRVCHWIERIYVSERYKGTVLTDFDEAHPVFPSRRFSMNLKVLTRPRKAHEAKFSLESLMSGRLDIRDALSALPPGMLDEGRVQVFIENYHHQINTGGGAYVRGNVDTSGGKFVGRDDN